MPESVDDRPPTGHEVRFTLRELVMNYYSHLPPDRPEYRAMRELFCACVVDSPELLLETNEPLTVDRALRAVGESGRVDREALEQWADALGRPVEALGPPVPD